MAKLGRMKLDSRREIARRHAKCVLAVFRAPVQFYGFYHRNASFHSENIESAIGQCSMLLIVLLAYSFAVRYRISDIISESRADSISLCLHRRGLHRNCIDFAASLLSEYFVDCDVFQ